MAVKINDWEGFHSTQVQIWEVSGPGQVAQLVRASSWYAIAVSLSQINKYFLKSIF